MLNSRRGHFYTMTNCTTSLYGSGDSVKKNIRGKKSADICSNMSEDFFFFFGIKYLFTVCSEIRLISLELAQFFVRRKLQIFTMRDTVAPRSSIQLISNRELQTCKHNDPRRKAFWRWKLKFFNLNNSFAIFHDIF